MGGRAFLFQTSGALRGPLPGKLLELPERRGGRGTAASHLEPHNRASFSWRTLTTSENSSSSGGEVQGSIPELLGQVTSPASFDPDPCLGIRVRPWPPVGPAREKWDVVALSCSEPSRPYSCEWWNSSQLIQRPPRHLPGAHVPVASQDMTMKMPAPQTESFASWDHQEGTAPACWCWCSSPQGW